MRIGMCTSVDHLGAASDAGYDFAEMTITGALFSEQDDAAFAPIRKKISASPIRIEAFNCLFPRKMKVTGPQVDLPAITQYLHRALNCVAECGATIVVFESGGARRIPEDYPAERGWEQLADVARLAGDIAGRHNITIVMEGEDVAFNFKGFLNALNRSGYSGRLSIEYNPGLLRKKTPPLTDAYRAIRLFVQNAARN